jgi:drug/metabolite transporter (DMT)-like permease
MKMLIQFAPWIAFSLVSGIDWRLGLAVGLISQIVVILAVRPVRIGVLNGAMLAFFVVLGVFAVLRPDSSIQDHVDTISTGWLAIVAAASLVLGHPFTLDFSRDSVSPEIARSERFMAVNRTITGVWAACFGGMAAVGAIAAATDRPTLKTVATIVLIVVAVHFTIRYPQQARDRALAEAEAA